MSSPPWSRCWRWWRFLKIWQPATILATIRVAAATERHDAMHSYRRRAQGVVAVLARLGLHLPRRSASRRRRLSFPALGSRCPRCIRLCFEYRRSSPYPTPEDAIADLNLLSLPGTAVFAGGASRPLAWPFAGPDRRIFGRTVIRMAPSLLAISFMVGLAFVTRYSGMDTVLGLSMTHTGAAFPFFGTLLGWLGVALTGTDAGSNALFGNLQKVTAERLGLSPVLMAAANSSGGVMGKMIDAQSIVVAGAATQQVGREAEIFRAVIKHSLALVVIVGLIVTAYAFLIPGWVPRIDQP